MIQPLRNVHRHLLVGLAVLLPMILWAGLSARRAAPVTAPGGPELPASWYLMRKSDHLWSKHMIGSEFYGDSQHADVVHVVFRPVSDINEPDLLLYWYEGGVPVSALPQSSQVMGRFSSNTAFLVPKGATQVGQFLLYSLPHNEIVDVGMMEKLP